MKVKTLSALAGLGGAMIMSSSASADFTGLSIQSSVVGTRTVHRLFANFSNPADAVVLWGHGDPTDPTVLLTNAVNGGVVIRNTGIGGIGLGGGFLNTAGQGSNSLPPTASAVPSDSYFSIGTDLQAYPATGDPWLTNLGLETLGTPTVPGQAELNQTGASGQLVTIPSSSAATGNQPNPAWNAGSTQDGNASGVLLAQFAVGLGQHVEGTIGLIWAPAGNVSNAIVASNLAFNSVPAPGALALLGLAGLVGSRRRRA
jgi:MYXO-CTERM domain-containing protein